MILEYDIGCLLVLLNLLQVLKTIFDLLPIAPDVQQMQVTLDFEMAMWAALRIILPDVQIKGCVFHWTQAIWRKVSHKVEKILYSKSFYAPINSKLQHPHLAPLEKTGHLNF